MSLKLQTILIGLFAALMYCACGADAIRLGEPGQPVIVQPAEAAQPPIVKNTVNVPAQPPAVNNVTVPPAVTDWNALLAQIAAAFTLLAGGVATLTHHRKSTQAGVTDETAWQEVLASCFLTANGDLDAALLLIPAAYQARFNEPISAADTVAAKQGLAALRLANCGLIPEDPAVIEAKKNLAVAQAKSRAPIVATLIAFAFLLVFPGCNSDRPQSVKDAEAKEQKKYEDHAANQDAVISGYDAALGQSQTNLFTELHNERISDIQNRVAAHPEDAADGIAAAAAANLLLNNQISSQNAAQASLRNIVAQSKATNLAQARQLHDAIQKFDSTAPFNAAAAAQSVASTVQSLIPAPTPIVTKSAALAPKPAVTAPPPKAAILP